jgi:hypothetical protein
LSALTKLFVILLIVCSLLLTAATVVFVNRTENYREMEELASARLRLAAEQRDTARAAVASAQQRETEIAGKFNSTTAMKDKEIERLMQLVASKDGEINKRGQDLAQNQGTIAQQASALDTIQKTVNALSERNKALVEENGQVRVTNAELVGVNTDYSKQIAELERERRWQKEIIEQQKAELTKLNNLVQEHRITTSPRAALRTAPDVKGAIREVQFKDGMAFATITVGAASKVTKGMQFSVIGGNQFLGFLTIESVDQNTAFGRLEGPRIADVKPQDQVLSQL